MSSNQEPRRGRTVQLRLIPLDASDDPQIIKAVGAAAPTDQQKEESTSFGDIPADAEPVPDAVKADLVAGVNERLDAERCELVEKREQGDTAAKTAELITRREAVQEVLSKTGEVASRLPQSFMEEHRQCDSKMPWWRLLVATLCRTQGVTGEMPAHPEVVGPTDAKPSGS